MDSHGVPTIKLFLNSVSYIFCFWEWRYLKNKTVYVIVVQNYVKLNSTWIHLYYSNYEFLDFISFQTKKQCNLNKYLLLCGHFVWFQNLYFKTLVLKTLSYFVYYVLNFSPFHCKWAKNEINMYVTVNPQISFSLLGFN